MKVTGGHNVITVVAGVKPVWSGVVPPSSHSSGSRWNLSVDKKTEIIMSF